MHSACQLMTAAFALLTSSALAQSTSPAAPTSTQTPAPAALNFANTSFTAPAIAGQTWPISFTAGTGAPVSLAFGNSTWAYIVVADLSAPGTYNWNVAVPAGTVSGRYQLALLQPGSSTFYSPLFDFVVPAAPTSSASTSMGVPTTTVTVTAVYLPTTTPAASVTYIYWEEQCGCHRTSSCAATAMPASSAMSSTTVTYFDHDGCRCSKTVEASCAPTVLPVPASNWTAPAMNTHFAAPAPTEPCPTESTSPSVSSSAMAPVYTGAAAPRTGMSAYGLGAVLIAVGWML